MNIGGFLPLSLIDYPGTPSAVVFTNGCNLRCPYCHNPQLAKGKASRIPEGEVKEQLISLKGKVQGVVISGGEPTLQYDLFDFCMWCKLEGFKVKIDTNGSGFGSKALEIADYIALDLKHFYFIPPKSMPVSFLGFLSTRGAIDRVGCGEVRITCARPFVDEVSLGTFIECSCPRKGEGDPIYLQHCNVTPQILDPGFFERGEGRAWTQDEINSFVERYGKTYNVKAR